MALPAMRDLISENLTMNTALLFGASLLLATAITGATAAEQPVPSTGAEASHFQPYADSTGGLVQSHGELAAGSSANPLTSGIQLSDDTSKGDRCDLGQHASAHLVPHTARWSERRSMG
jgi:hypothetical protein